MEESKSVRSIYVPEEELNKRNLVSDLIKEVEADLEKVMASCNDWVQIQNKKVYYVISKNIIIALPGAILKSWIRLMKKA